MISCGIEREGSDIVISLSLSPSFFSYMLQRSTMLRWAVHRLPVCYICSIEKDSDESDNVVSALRKLSRVQFLRASCRHASLKYTFLETLILISRCENNIKVAVCAAATEWSPADASQFSRITRNKVFVSESPCGILCRAEKCGINWRVTEKCGIYRRIYCSNLFSYLAFYSL